LPSIMLLRAERRRRLSNFCSETLWIACSFVFEMHLWGHCEACENIPTAHADPSGPAFTQNGATNTFHPTRYRILLMCVNIRNISCFKIGHHAFPMEDASRVSRASISHAPVEDHTRSSKQETWNISCVPHQQTSPGRQQPQTHTRLLPQQSTSS